MEFNVKMVFVLSSSACVVLLLDFLGKLLEADWWDAGTCGVGFIVALGISLWASARIKVLHRDRQG